MKRFKRFVCLLLIAAMFVVTPAYAAEEVVTAEGADVRSSSYFLCSSVFLHKTSATSFEAWFDVGAMGIMEELGATVIKIQRSADGENWVTMRTFRSSTYSGMICENTAAHTYGAAYTSATPGYYYRAYIVLYAKDENGYAEMYRYTSVMQM